MKKLLMFIAVFMIATNAQAGQEGVGLGIILGEPTGLSFKMWRNDKEAVDAAAAWSFLDHASFQVHADYLVHPVNIKLSDVKGRLLCYWGVGGRLRLQDANGGNSLFGIRVPLGVSLLFSKAPVELFAEVVPILDLIPRTDVSLNAAVGARYYFK